VNKYYFQADYVVKNVSSFDQISTICCAYTRFIDCIDKYSFPCDDEETGYIRDYITNYMNDLFANACVGHFSHDICMKKMPQSMNELESVEKAARPIRKSILFPSLETILNLNENEWSLQQALFGISK